MKERRYYGKESDFLHNICAVVPFACRIRLAGVFNAEGISISQSFTQRKRDRLFGFRILSDVLLLYCIARYAVLAGMHENFFRKSYQNNIHCFAVDLCCCIYCFCDYVAFQWVSDYV